MLDFPTPTSIGQVYAGTNGVNYIWTGTLWLASGASAGGDFCATGTVTLPANAVFATLIPTTIISGNTSGAYSTSTGRWTPPAGRYAIYSACSASTTAAAHMYYRLRKNGTNIVDATDTSNANANYGEPSVSAIVDTNGTDWFDIIGATSHTTAATGAIHFQAFPISGIKGPPGDPYPSTVGGDASVYNGGGNLAIATGATTIVLPTVRSGNSPTAWYNTTTGRYTPPAGRFFLAASLTGICPSASAIVSMYLAKNGIIITQSTNTTFAANAYVTVSIDLTVDTNGSDYYELMASSNVGGTTSPQNGAMFTAYPISGIKGPTGDTGAGGPPGEATTVLQTRMFQTGAAATGTTVMVYDDTIPQITEGTEFMTLAFTPLSATSKLIITVNAAFSHSATVAIIGALFRDSTANALASMYLTQPAGNQYNNLSFAHTMTSGTTSPINFRFRAGGNAPGTLIFNGQAGTRLFGGTMASSIVIQEVSP